MRLIHTLPAFLLTLALMAACSSFVQAENPVWKPIADGKTIAGWHKNGLGDWTVEEGAYVGRSNNEKLYGHLVSDDTFQDFTVRFQFQCTSGDSGFFIRTKMEDPDKTLGLQVQVGPCGSGTGGIYESYGRGWLQQPTQEQEKSCYREGTWNEMIISAHGPRVTVHVNGFKTADLNDDQISKQAGVFALQMHSGVVNHTMFKDLAILDKGEIVPKRFLYDAVEPIKSAADGSLSLDAAAGLGVGPSITYMPEWGAFGSFTDKDRIQWPIEATQDRTYDVWAEWSVADTEAGSPFVFSVGDQQISGKVAKTGSSETYLKAKIGQLRVPAGASTAVLRADGAISATPGNLRQIKLVPLAK